MADQSSFDEFYLMTRDAVLRQLTAMTLDRELAADAVQEAYARAWQRWSRVSRLAEPRAWVRTVAWRIAVSQHRRSVVAARFAPVLGRRLPQISAPDDERMDVEAALRRLPAEHRRALVLHHLCGLSVPEVAAETGVAEGTVKSRLSRGRASLAGVLGDGYGPSLGALTGTKEAES